MAASLPPVSQIAALSCLPYMVACCSRTLHQTCRIPCRIITDIFFTVSLCLQSQGRASTRLAGLWGTAQQQWTGCLGPREQSGRWHWGLLQGHSQTYFCSVLCAEFFDSKAMSRAEKNGDMDIRRSKNPVWFPTNLSGRGQYLLGLILGVVFIPFIWSLQTRYKFRASV